MQIKFTFNKPCPPAEFKSSVGGFRPVELKVKSNNPKTRDLTLDQYIRTLILTFAGVHNRATGDISEVEIKKNWFGVLKKKEDVNYWHSFIDRTSVVVYEVELGAIQENYHIAEGFYYDLKNKELLTEWIDIVPTPYELRKNAISAIALFTEYTDKYNLKWDKPSNSIILTDKKGNLLKIEDVEEPDIYCVLKLITLLLYRGKHVGVFFIDCEKLPERTIKYILKLIQEVFEDTFVFLFNCGNNLTIERDVFELPDFNLY